MTNKTPPEQFGQIFWKDKPDAQIFSQSSQKFIYSMLGFYRILFLILIISLGFGIIKLVSSILAWFWLGYFFVMLAISIYLGRRRKSAIQNIVNIQQRAFDATGASLIGSAIHVAGHPRLEREQSVVLALILPDLAIYSYESPQPLFLIPIQHIISNHTVVYDDERIPHVEVIDSAAQAIQLVVKYGGQQITCLFRSMKKVRPIDWYHAIQKAKQ